MPRAALRKPSPQLDWKPFFFDRESLPVDISSPVVFGNDRPLEIEVGSGKGLFLQTESARVPEHNFLGVEIAQKYAVHGAARLAKRSLHNAKMFAGDATPLFATATEHSTTHSTDAIEMEAVTRIADRSVEAVHVYFPDPWWKKRHRKRRVLSEANIRNFSRALRTGGRLHFWTDVLDYFELTIELIAEIAPELGVPFPQVERESTHDLDFHTHFERRSRRLGIPVYRVHYIQRG